MLIVLSLFYWFPNNFAMQQLHELYTLPVLWQLSLSWAVIFIVCFAFLFILEIVAKVPLCFSWNLSD